MIHPLDPAALDRLAATLPAGTPVFMLNLLRFAPDGGRAAYFDRYVPAFRAIAAELGVEGAGAIWIGQVAGIVAGPADEAWDAALVVRYPSLGAFRAIVESPRYRATAAPHREGALLDWRLIAQTEAARPA
jgi:hypothetical protein